MMKNFKKFTAFVLALCMVFSLSVAAFAAKRTNTRSMKAPLTKKSPCSPSEAATSGTIPGSSIKWSLDSKGWLTISGSGEAPVFTSADDQPWAAVRDQITEVWFEDVETLTIPDLAYWFEGCINLTTAELPLAPVIGKHAFYNCPKLSTLTMYYGETVLNSIGEDAFWRETDSGDTLYIAYIIGYPEATVPFHTYDWAASNRSDRYFYDLYGVYRTRRCCTTATQRHHESARRCLSCSPPAPSVGNCPSCKQYSFQGTYVSKSHIPRAVMPTIMSAIAAITSNILALTRIRDHGSGCVWFRHLPGLRQPYMGTAESAGEPPAPATVTELCCACGQSKSETIYASGHSYSLWSWEQYSATQHRREAYCRNCGDSDYEYASHSMSYGSWSNSSDSQHSRTASCRTCGYSTTDYGNHSYSTGAWSKYSDTQHRRSKTCSGCGASTYDYADHSYSYGSWVGQRNAA